MFDKILTKTKTFLLEMDLIIIFFANIQSENRKTGYL